MFKIIEPAGLVDSATVKLGVFSRIDRSLPASTKHPQI